jgi:hypothetical protein
MQASTCCALRTTVAPSVLAIKARNPQGPASGSAAAVALPTMVGLRQQSAEPPRLAARIPDHLNDSLTYLRTARLRL